MFFVATFNEGLQRFFEQCDKPILTVIGVPNFNVNQVIIVKYIEFKFLIPNRFLMCVIKNFGGTGLILKFQYQIWVHFVVIIFKVSLDFSHLNFYVECSIDHGLVWLHIELRFSDQCFSFFLFFDDSKNQFIYDAADFTLLNFAITVLVDSLENLGESFVVNHFFWAPLNKIENDFVDEVFRFNVPNMTGFIDIIFIKDLVDESLFWARLIHQRFLLFFNLFCHVY